MKTALVLNLAPSPAAMATAAGAMAVTAAGEPVKRVQLFPIGDINARDGRKWHVRDKAHAQAIVDATLATAGSTDLPIDYDHQLVFAAKDGVGGKAPASGWMSNWGVEDDGIYADVEWTGAAHAALKAKEYRYISPYFSYDKKTGAVLRIWHAGLTNFPAITELAAVASADPEGNSMDLTALAAAFGLPATATLDQILAAANAAQAAAAAQLNTIARAAGLADGATAEAVASAITARSTDRDPTQWAPASELAAANARLVALETGAAEEKATAAVDAAIAAGKVVPANRDWALGYAKKDLAGFNTMVGNAPTVVTGKAAAASTQTGEVTLTDEERATASALGIPEAAYLQSKKDLGI